MGAGRQAGRQAGRCINKKPLHEKPRRCLFCVVSNDKAENLRTTTAMGIKHTFPRSCHELRRRSRWARHASVTKRAQDIVQVLHDTFVRRSPTHRQKLCLSF